MRISLSVSAELDLLEIFRQGLDLFGRVQALSYAEGLEANFALLAQNPRVGRDRDDIAPGLRTYPNEAHVIVYRADPQGGVRILRVRHARENWMDDPLGDDA